MTNQLIPVFAGEIQNQSAQLVDARLLHSFLDVARDFSNWIKKRIADYGFVKDQDYIEVFAKSGENPQGGRPSIDYHLTIDMAKELSMVERNEKGKQARRYFIEMERRALEHLQHATCNPQLPEPKTKKALPHGLTLEQQDTIKQLVKDRVAELPKNKQAKAAITCWSAIKSKYGKTYKQVEPEHFTGIVSLLARLPLEGELLDAEPNPPANTLSIDLDNLGNAGVNRVFVQFKHAGLSHGRWLVTLNDNALCIQQMDRDEFIATGPRLAALIGDSMGRAVDRQHLPAIIEAAAKRLNNSQQRTQ